MSRVINMLKIGYKSLSLKEFYLYVTGVDIGI